MISNSQNFGDIEFNFLDSFEQINLITSVISTKSRFTFSIAKSGTKYLLKHTGDNVDFATLLDTIDFYYGDNLKITSKNSILFVNSNDLPTLSVTEIKYVKKSSQVTIPFASNLKSDYQGFVYASEPKEIESSTINNNNNLI